MNSSNTAKLRLKFPALLRKHSSTPTPLDVRGVETCDGWYALIHNLLKDIEATALAAGLDPIKLIWPHILQIKSKFGALSVSIDASSLYETHALSKDISDLEIVRNLIATAEAASLKTCESCGEPGAVIGGDWLHVKCPACEANKEE